MTATTNLPAPLAMLLRTVVAQGGFAQCGNGLVGLTGKLRTLANLGLVVRDCPRHWVATYAGTEWAAANPGRGL